MSQHRRQLEEQRRQLRIALLCATLLRPGVQGCVLVVLVSRRFVE